MLINENTTTANKYPSATTPSLSSLSNAFVCGLRLVSFMRSVNGKTARIKIKQAKNGKRMPYESATTPPMKGAIVKPNSHEMFVHPYAEAIFSVEDASATIAHRSGIYNPVANPARIAQGTKSTQPVANAYINGGKAAKNVPKA